MQSTNVPVDLHSTSVFRIVQTLNKLSGEFLQQSDTANRAGLILADICLALMTTENFLLRFQNHEMLDKQGTLMLSTRDPGGDSCRAMVSEVSIVKYTSMGHSLFPAGRTHVQNIKTLQKDFRSSATMFWFHSLVHFVVWLSARAPKRRQNTKTSNPSIFVFPYLNHN